MIRGVGLIDGRGFDNAVGVFIDGIFVSGRAAQNVGMLDLERVEVVKGPQSALYGRNTFAGAINYVTTPLPEGLSAKAEATLGSDDLRRFSGSVAGAVNSWFSARLAVSWEDDGGTYRNSGPLGTGDGIGGGKSKAALLTLQFRPTDDLSITATGSWNDDFADNRPLSPQANNCGPLDPMGAGNTSLISSDLRTPLYFCGEGQPLKGGHLSMSPAAYAFDAEAKRATLELEWLQPAFKLSWLNAYTTSKSLSQLDLDRTQLGEGNYGYLPRSAFVAAGSPTFNLATGMGFICSGFIPAGPCSSKPGRERRALQPGDPGALQHLFRRPGPRPGLLVVGAAHPERRRDAAALARRPVLLPQQNDDTTYVGIDASEAVRRLNLPLSQIQFVLLDSGGIIPGLAPRGYAVNFPQPLFPPQSLFVDGPGVALGTYTPLVDIQKSAFGSLEYDFTDRLTGTVELRYTKESQDLDNVFDNYFGGRGHFGASSSFTDPRLTLRYKPGEDLTFYASAARGTRSGGVNALITDPAYIEFSPRSTTPSSSAPRPRWPTVGCGSMPRCSAWTGRTDSCGRLRPAAQPPARWSPPPSMSAASRSRAPSWPSRRDSTTIGRSTPQSATRTRSSARTPSRRRSSRCAGRCSPAARPRYRRSLPAAPPAPSATRRASSLTSAATSCCAPRR